MDQQSELAKAEAELGLIDAGLADLERQRGLLLLRRDNLKAFLDLGRSLFGEESPTPIPAPRHRIRLDGPVSALAAEHQREQSMKARILDLSRNAILRHGALHTVQLVKLIEDTGLQITGKDKNVTVSVILSRSPDFVSDRSRGWSLIAEKTPADVATSPGSSAT